MNKTEFIAAVAAKEGLEKKTAEKAVNAVIACIGDALASGDKIQIAGFGTFEVRERAAKTARNPRNRRDHRCPRMQGSRFQGRQRS